MRTPPAACTECRNLIGGYVLGALERDEADEVRRHLAACSKCAAEHARLADLPALLTLAGGDETAAERPPPALEEAVLDRFATEHRARRGSTRNAASRRWHTRAAAALASLRRPLPAASLGAFVAAVAAAVAIAVMPAGHSQQTASTAGEMYRANLSGLAAAPGATASARLETSTVGTRVWMRVSGLRGNPDDVYELWCVRDNGSKVSAGTFRVDARGQAVVDLTTAAVPGEYHVMRIERHGATGGGQSVMAGQIRYGSA